MDKFHNAGLYFESRGTSTKKVFVVRFPIDVLLSIQWEQEEIKILNTYDHSEKISDKLEMLAMIARKIEDRHTEGHDLVLK